MICGNDMSFVNSFFLFALVGAAVPVLIHLLTRDRIQTRAIFDAPLFRQRARSWSSGAKNSRN